MELNDHFLTAAGLGALPEVVKPAYLRRIHEELQLSVGLRLTQHMTERQLEEFEALRDEPERVAAAWLHVNFPSHSRVVREELDATRRRLIDQAPQILALELAFHADPESQPTPTAANADRKEN